MASQISIQKKTFNQNKAIEAYLSSIVFDDKSQQVADILMLIESPFYDVKTNDAISQIFHKFHTNTHTHPALPVFAYLSMLSAWTVQNKTTCRIPLTRKPTELDTWVLLLSETGATKSLSIGTIQELLPKNPETGRPVVEANFIQPASNAALIQQLDELPDHRGYWQQDEAAQFMKQIDQFTGPLAGVNQTMLITKDHGTVDRATKKDGKKQVKNPVLTVLMINTIDSMIRSMSQESMTNGIFRRFTTAWAGKDSYTSKKDFGDMGLFSLKDIQDETLEQTLLSVFTQRIQNVEYTFTPGCVKLYNKTFKTFWEKQYCKFLSQHENYFRTYMMEAWKYAVFHHITFKKAGREVDEFSLQWGMKVSMYLLNSLQSFIARKANERLAEIPYIKTKIEKFQEFIVENEKKEFFGIRAICRKFNMSKDEAMSLLSSIKTHDKKFQTKLYDDLKKYQGSKS